MVDGGVDVQGFVAATACWILQQLKTAFHDGLEWSIHSNS